MIDRSPTPGTTLHGTLLLRAAGACDLDPEHLLEVFGEQRRRFAAVLHEFGPADWAAPTRCADWSAHDVVRHLCDCNTHIAAAGPDDRTLDLTAGFDPRTTPSGWLTASAGEPPEATLSRFLATTEELLAVLRARLAQTRRFDVRLPYGPMDWTVFVLHGFWDCWLHERDVLLPWASSTPLTATPPATQPPTGRSSPLPSRQCSATPCARSSHSAEMAAACSTWTATVTPSRSPSPG
jgi:uncharacterized protein (TIGR03083 family)